MAEIAVIQALSTIAKPVGSSGQVRAPSGCAPLWEWFLPGHVLELSAQRELVGNTQGVPARLSVATRLVAQAQHDGEPVAWVASTVELYPPDLAAAGVDLASLVLVQPPPRTSAVLSQHPAPLGTSAVHDRKRPLSPSEQAVRAAEVLLRSGAFGLVVLDLSAGVPQGSLGWMSKLHGLLRRHAARLLVLTSTQTRAVSLGPLVTLRVQPRARRVSAERWVIEHEVSRNKLGCSVSIRPDVRVAPEGVCSVCIRPGIASRGGEHGDTRSERERCA